MAVARFLLWSRDVLDTARNLYYRLPDGLQRAVLVRRRSPIWLKAGIVFIHVPKAAGTSISEALYGQFMGHVRASDVQRWGSSEVRRLPSCAITRNPWDRLVSAYRFARRGGGLGGPHAGGVWRPEQYLGPEFETFERFVSEWLAVRDPNELDLIFQPQSRFVCDSAGKVLVDHLGRVEDLGATYDYLRAKVPDLPPFAASNRSGERIDYRSFYTPRLADVVAKIYAADVSRFGYSFS